MHWREAWDSFNRSGFYDRYRTVIKGELNRLRLRYKWGIRLRKYWIPRTIRRFLWWMGVNPLEETGLYFSCFRAISLLGILSLLKLYIPKPRYFTILGPIINLRCDNFLPSLDVECVVLVTSSLFCCALSEHSCKKLLF